MPFNRVASPRALESHRLRRNCAVGIRSAREFQRAMFFTALVQLVAFSSREKAVVHARKAGVRSPRTYEITAVTDLG